MSAATPVFPARDTFDADPRITRKLARLYRYLRGVLDFRDPRACPLSGLQQFAGVDRGDGSRGLRTLVAWGYLVPAPGRCYTLAWSVREDLRWDRARAA